RELNYFIKYIAGRRGSLVFLLPDGGRAKRPRRVVCACVFISSSFIKTSDERKTYCQPWHFFHLFGSLNFIIKKQFSVSKQGARGGSRAKEKYHLLGARSRK
ncbi:MAG: hypothetical protein ACRDCT_29125, partial [Shewanella sp.]